MSNEENSASCRKMFHSKFVAVFGRCPSTYSSLPSFVLERILSGEPTEVVVEGIHEYLASVGEKIRNNKIPLDDFIINKVSRFPFCPA